MNRTQAKPEYLSRTDIEERVGHMLKYIFPDSGSVSGPPDLTKIVQILRTKYNVHFSFSENLGSLPSSEKILGKFTVDPLTIHVCNSLDDWSAEFCRTLGHELGHLVLHRKMIGRNKYISKKKPIIDTASQLRYRETAELSDLGWVEWQANEFALCLILPRRFLQALVIAVQKEIGIKKNLGTMYLDDQPCNKQDCHTIVARIAEISSAKDTLLWRRLRFLGILEDHQNKRTQKMFGALDTLFETRSLNTDS